MKLYRLIGLLLSMGIVQNLQSSDEPSCPATSYVTYDFSGGRFGDNLITYCHARWLSYTYDIPLLYRQFEYGDDLVLSTLHHKDVRRLDDAVTFDHLKGKYMSLPLQRCSGKTYVIPYFPECPSDIQGRFHFAVDWDDPAFKQIIKREIAAIKPPKPLQLPKYKHQVAVHIRTGAGFDKVLQLRSRELRDELGEAPQGEGKKSKRKGEETNMKVVGKSKFADRLHPLKFPPTSFYANQLRLLSEYLGDTPMLVYIFTDSNVPGELVEYLDKHVGKSNIEFYCRPKGNKHDANVLDDFFALASFEYMIRGESNFSIMAEKIGNFKGVIYPTGSTWYRNMLSVDTVAMTVRDQDVFVQLPSYAQVVSSAPREERQATFEAQHMFALHKQLKNDADNEVHMSLRESNATKQGKDRR